MVQVHWSSGCYREWLGYTFVYDRLWNNVQLYHTMSKKDVYCRPTCIEKVRLQRRFTRRWPDFKSTSYRDRQECLGLNQCIGSRGNLPANSVSHHCTYQTAWNFFGMLPWLFLDIFWLQSPKRIFPISVIVPQICGKRGAPQMVSSVSPVRRAADGKIWRLYIHVFVCMSSQWL